MASAIHFKELNCYKKIRFAVFAIFAEKRNLLDKRQPSIIVVHLP